MSNMTQSPKPSTKAKEHSKNEEITICKKCATENLYKMICKKCGCLN